MLELKFTLPTHPSLQSIGKCFLYMKFDTDGKHKIHFPRKNFKFTRLSFYFSDRNEYIIQTCRRPAVSWKKTQRFFSLYLFFNLSDRFVFVTHTLLTLFLTHNTHTNKTSSSCFDLKK